MLKNLKNLLNAEQTYNFFTNKSIPENGDFFVSLKKWFDSFMENIKQKTQVRNLGF